MKKYFLLFLIFITFVSYSQEIIKKEQPGAPVQNLEKNGVKYAILKVQYQDDTEKRITRNDAKVFVTETEECNDYYDINTGYGFSVHYPIYGKFIKIVVFEENGEKTVYMKDIKHEMLEQGKTYIAELVKPKVNVRQQYVDLKFNVSHGTIIFNNNNIEIPFENGKYSYSGNIGKLVNVEVKVDNCYYPKISSFFVKDDKYTVNIDVERKCGSITVKTLPEDGATIYFDGNLEKDKTTITINNVMSDENHSIKVMKNMFLSKDTIVKIKEEENKTITIRMKENFGTITLSACSDCQIYQNGVKIADKSKTDRFPTGELTIEVRKPYHKSKFQTISVMSGEVRTVNLSEPEPIFANIEIKTNGIDADIFIDNQKRKETPDCFIYDILIGTHSLKLLPKDSKYQNYESNFELTQEKETKRLEIAFSEKPKTATISINSNPSSADVYVNGENKGYTPLILNDLAPQKEFKIEIKKDGYENYSTNITTQAGKTENVYGTLKEMLKSSIEMVFVKGGTFTMGCTSEQSDCDDDEKPTHQVTLNDYYIGKYEVTQKQWKEIMGSYPSELYNTGCDECPVEMVSWNDVQEFIKKLNEKTSKKYRLPTEAEWEYAARGGASSARYKYSGSNNIEDVAWYTSNSSETHNVGMKQANELGIYDMTGNVREWCSDLYDAYSSSSQTNPIGAFSGSFHVVRGGSWSGGARGCSVSFRYRSTPSGRGNNLGFRLILFP